MAGKFYGVKAGRKPGIYMTWAECKAQVDGYGGAIYKSFQARDEAEKYVSGAAEAAAKQAIDEETGYHIYVDGSYKNQTAEYSWAFAVYHNQKLIFTNNGKGEDEEAAKMRNVAGEIAAAVEAIKWAAERSISPITIHHDYMGIAAWARGEWQAKNKFTLEYARFTKANLGWVTFNKVAGHSGVAGNELVDKLAKEAINNS